VTFSSDLESSSLAKADDALQSSSVVAGKQTLFNLGIDPLPGQFAQCAAETPVRSWPSWPGVMTPDQAHGKQIIEYAKLSVTLPGTPALACVAAKTLAADVWPELPRQ
jgi:hypothetical protein